MRTSYFGSSYGALFPTNNWSWSHCCLLLLAFIRSESVRKWSSFRFLSGIKSWIRCSSCSHSCELFSFWILIFEVFSADRHEVGQKSCSGTPFTCKRYWKIDLDTFEFDPKVWISAISGDFDPFNNSNKNFYYFSDIQSTLSHTVVHFSRKSSQKNFNQNHWISPRICEGDFNDFSSLK